MADFELLYQKYRLKIYTAIHSLRIFNYTNEDTVLIRDSYYPFQVLLDNRNRRRARYIIPKVMDSTFLEFITYANKKLIRGYTWIRGNLVTRKCRVK